MWTHKRFIDSVGHLLLTRRLPVFPFHSTVFSNDIPGNNHGASSKNVGDPLSTAGPSGTDADDPSVTSFSLSQLLS